MKINELQSVCLVALELGCDCGVVCGLLGCSHFMTSAKTLISVILFYDMSVEIIVCNHGITAGLRFLSQITCSVTPRGWRIHAVSGLLPP